MNKKLCRDQLIYTSLSSCINADDAFNLKERWSRSQKYSEWGTGLTQSKERLSQKAEKNILEKEQNGEGRT